MERRIALAELGWTIIHVTSDLLNNRTWLLVQRTVDALRNAGCAWVDERRESAREILYRVS